MKAPGPGELRDRVRFERRAEQPDGYGNTEADWAEILPGKSERYVRLLPTRGGEQVIAGRLQGVRAFDLSVSADSLTRQVGPGDRVVNVRTGEALNVRWAADLDGRNTWMLMQVEAGVAV